MGNDAPSPAWQVKGGSFDQALANGRSLLDQHPAVALEQAQTLLRPGPEPRALRLAADALRRLGKAADAEAAELAAIQAGLRNPDLEKAALRQENGRSSEAAALVEEFLGQEPDDLLALTIAAETAISLWDLERAEAMLGKVLGRAPTFLRASMLLAKCLMRGSRVREAIAVLDEVLARKPNNIAALMHMALLQADVGDLEQAALVDERLLSLDQAHHDRWIHYAQRLRILGRSDDAQRAFRRALALDPSSGAAWWGLANYYPSDLDGDDIAAMHKALAGNAGSLGSSGAPLLLALGIVADSRGQHFQAFEHFTAGKRLRLAAQPYNADTVTTEVDEAIRIYTREFYAERTTAGPPDCAPIFIIGMPRSGSTLVERILGRHSAVEGAGELPILPRMVEKLRYRAGGGSYASLVGSMEPSELTQLGQTYIERSLDFRRSDAPQFIDKLNLNWLHIGLIRLILPNAKVIDVRRSPLDCCWANFKMMFAEGHPAANDLRHLGLFYRDYIRLVESIEAAKPGILSVRYEDLVDDIETVTRRMLGFLGLDYEPDCIDFHLATGAVATASSEQVRRPLNREGIGAWRPYAQWLGPLRDALGPLDQD